jgi:hypothetical protein
MAGKRVNTPSTLLRAAAVPEPIPWWQGLLTRLRPASDSTASSQAAPDPRVFQPTDEGSGCFGRWILDDTGLPAYEYELDQYLDERARYPNSLNIDRRDHWHQIGNFRITGLASNDGTVQVYLADRGGVFLNQFDAWPQEPAGIGRRLRLLLYRIARRVLQKITRLVGRQSPFTPFMTQAHRAPPPDHAQAAPRGLHSLEAVQQLAPPDQAAAFSAQSVPQPQTAPPPFDPYALAGGFGYIHDGESCWATAYRYRPAGAQTRRVFGIGYFETEMTYRNLRVTRRVYAPYGDAPLLLADIRIENLSGHDIGLSHYEYWDVNVHQLQLEWLRTGDFGAISNQKRRDINRHFTPGISYEPGISALRFQQRLKSPAPPEALDWSPADIFLADLSGSPDAFYIHKQGFFGGGGAKKPDAARQRRPGDSIPTQPPPEPMPYCLALRRDLHLAPGQSIDLRYAYGTARPDAPLSLIDAFRPPADTLSETRSQWKNTLAYFTTGDDPVLQRETAWHAYYLASAVVYSAFHHTYTVPQGSAYLYIHGADGAARDLALFAIPITYLHPQIARDMLCLIMRTTDARTGQISYAFGGHGVVSDGMHLHASPSDLDLFFLLAISEYLAATGDVDFLAQEVPYYPPDTPPAAGGLTVLDHIRTAVRHIFEGTGIGEHGLIKVGSGDWSDSIVLETALSDGIGPAGVTYLNSKKHGESVLNTQMALYILPLLAAVIRPHDPTLADYIHDAPSQPDRMQRLRQATAQQWNPQGWYNRALLRGHNDRVIPIQHFTLESQPWALISGLAAETGTEAALIENIDQMLDSPSPIGAALVENGMVWPAISQLLTWAYARCGRADLAWRSLHRHTFAMHSLVYPHIWNNTWSGPDGVNGLVSDLPGGVWASPITPMTDFPIMNANQDALALLGLLRVCGIEAAPAGDGLLIDPHVPADHFALDTPLLRLQAEPGQISGEYRPFVSGTRTLYVRLPAGASDVTAQIGGQTIADLTVVDQTVALVLSFSAGEAVPFAVSWRQVTP